MPLYYEGVGKKRQQVWESGLSYTAAKSRKAKIELEQANSCLLYTSDAADE